MIGIVLVISQDIIEIYLTPLVTAESYTVSNDTTPRTATITRQDPTRDLTDADEVTFLVDFDEDVANVDASDFVVTGAATAGSISVTENGDASTST